MGDLSRLHVHFLGEESSLLECKKKKNPTKSFNLQFFLTWIGSLWRGTLAELKLNALQENEVKRNEWRFPFIINLRETKLFHISSIQEQENVIY